MKGIKVSTYETSRPGFVLRHIQDMRNVPKTLKHTRSEGVWQAHAQVEGR